MEPGYRSLQGPAIAKIWQHRAVFPNCFGPLTSVLNPIRSPREHRTRSCGALFLLTAIPTLAGLNAGYGNWLTAEQRTPLLHSRPEIADGSGCATKRYGEPVPKGFTGLLAADVDGIRIYLPNPEIQSAELILTGSRRYLSC